ncbi:MAG: hypothetical protein MUE95_01290 [Cyclobacteriaceae bacterium]|nr:hypothetical protein [Cyclobacteriaceae bacterium]
MPELIPYPFILKQPDGAFSKGVMKINDMTEYGRAVRMMFRDSDLLIAQEFLPTAFDWRVGVLNGKALFVCKYYMADKHWQILNWNEKGENQRQDRCGHERS